MGTKVVALTLAPEGSGSHTAMQFWTPSSLIWLYPRIKNLREQEIKARWFNNFFQFVLLLRYSIVDTIRTQQWTTCHIQSLVISRGVSWSLVRHSTRQCIGTGKSTGWLVVIWWRNYVERCIVVGEPEQAAQWGKNVVLRYRGIIACRAGLWQLL